MPTSPPDISVLESIAIGSAAGSVDALFNHPIWSIKTLMQSKEPFTFNPAILYRGVGLDIVSNIPIAAFQVGFNRYIQKTFFSNSTELSHKQKMFSAFAAGMGSAFLICPTEMMMTWQCKTGYSLRVTGDYLFSQGGIRCFFTGFSATAARDSISSTFLLWVIPTLKTRIKAYYPNDGAASLLSGSLAGLSATILTQGIDTAKTTQQVSNPSLLFSFPAAVKKINQEDGFYGYFKGTIPRSINIIFSMTTMAWTIEKMEIALKRHKLKSN